AAGRVRVVRGGYGTQDAQFVGLASQTRHQLREMHSWNGRGDGPELASNFRWRIGFGVPRRVLRRPAHEKEDDAGFGLTAARSLQRAAGSGAPAEEIGHR